MVTHRELLRDFFLWRQKETPQTPRRRNLRILRFRASPKAQSLRCSSFPPHKHACAADRLQPTYRSNDRPVSAPAQSAVARKRQHPSLVKSTGYQRTYVEPPSNTHSPAHIRTQSGFPFGVWGAFFGQDQRKPPRSPVGGFPHRSPRGAAPRTPRARGRPIFTPP